MFKRILTVLTILSLLLASAPMTPAEARDDSDEKPVLIFVPGIMGTELLRQVHLIMQLWRCRLL